MTRDFLKVEVLRNEEGPDRHDVIARRISILLHSFRNAVAVGIPCASSIIAHRVSPWCVYHTNTSLLGV